MSGCRNDKFRARTLAVGLALMLGVAGCSFGPKVLERTHSKYNESIRRVYEEQLLQNLVRMRYNEVPFRLNVQSVAAQYELAGSRRGPSFLPGPESERQDLQEFHLDLTRPPVEWSESSDHLFRPIERRRGPALPDADLR